MHFEHEVMKNHEKILDHKKMVIFFKSINSTTLWELFAVMESRDLVLRPISASFGLGLKGFRFISVSEAQVLVTSLLSSDFDYCKDTA